jgi:hypothetical protein
MQDEDSRRRERRRQLSQLVALLAVVGTFFTLLNTYGSSSWWSRRITAAERAGELDRLLAYADNTFLDIVPGVRTSSAETAGSPEPREVAATRSKRASFGGATRQGTKRKPPSGEPGFQRSTAN